MIQFIAHETGPSHLTLEKIAFINKLNAEGVDAILYGTSHWPKNKCKYDSLHNFKIGKNSIIIIDGLKVESSFDLVNINRYAYSHGRKKRLLSYLSFLKKYLIHLISFKFNYKLICYKPNKFQNKFSIFSSTIFNNKDWSKLNLANLVNNTLSFELQDKLYIIADISDSNKTSEIILNSNSNEIILAGAIVEPLYFKEKIIPLMNEYKNKIKIIGFQEDLSLAQIDRHKPTSEVTASETMIQWKSLFSNIYESF